MELLSRESALVVRVENQLLLNEILRTLCCTRLTDKTVLQDNTTNEPHEKSSLTSSSKD